MRGAGLAAMAWGDRCRFAGIGNSGGVQDSSSHGDSGVTLVAASSGTRQSKCIFLICMVVKVARTVNVKSEQKYLA